MLEVASNRQLTLVLYATKNLHEQQTPKPEAHEP